MLPSPRWILVMNAFQMPIISTFAQRDTNFALHYWQTPCCSLPPLCHWVPAHLSLQTSLFSLSTVVISPVPRQTWSASQMKVALMPKHIFLVLFSPFYIKALLEAMFMLVFISSFSHTSSQNIGKFFLICLCHLHFHIPWIKYFKGFTRTVHFSCRSFLF